MTARRRIPVWVAAVYTAFIAVLVPSYLWTYGPANFLYYCDFAALLTCLGLWLQSPLLLGTQAVAVLVPQTVWVVDFALQLSGVKTPLAMTDYMFIPRYPLWVRGISTFHGWLPVLLLWAVRRVGYDRRSLAVQIPVGLALLLVCYLALTPAQNVNYVFGVRQDERQPWMRPDLWLLIVMAVAVFGMFVPAHLLLRRVMPRAGR